MTHQPKNTNITHRSPSPHTTNSGNKEIGIIKERVRVFLGYHFSSAILGMYIVRMTREVAYKASKIMFGATNKAIRQTLGQEVPQKSKDSAGSPLESVGLLPLFDPLRHNNAGSYYEKAIDAKDAKMGKIGEHKDYDTQRAYGTKDNNSEQ
ncbi:hypothetical protein Tco_0322898 [Tanacetum coccineum]